MRHVLMLFSFLSILGLSCAPTVRSAVEFQGWTQAQALGGRTPVPQATGLATTSASVTLGWNAMGTSSSSPTGYNVYRGTSSGAETFLVSTSSTSYTDTTVSPLTTYYYLVRPAQGSATVLTTSVDSEIKIQVPPVNMALVHRWIANWEMCSNLMGRPFDRNNNYRCAYVGPGNNGGYYDVGQNSFWDTVELGCNYTPPSPTAALSCGDLTNGCLNIGNPNNPLGGGGPPLGPLAGGLDSHGNAQVYYDRGSSQCYIWTSGTSWTVAYNGSDSQRALLASNKPGLPPLVDISQNHAGAICQQISVPGLGYKQIPKHSEQVVAAAWPTSFSDTTISTVEGGSASLVSTGFCNSNSGNGLSYDGNATPASLDTLPASSGSPSRPVRTGSIATQNCVSLYGIQDLVGNVHEWGSDQLGLCTIVAPYFCTGAVSNVDLTNTDWYWNNGTQPINFDGTIGVGGGASVIGNSTLSAKSFGATDFLPPLGLPLVGSVSSSYDSVVIGTNPGQFNPVKFHGNFIWYGIGSGNGARSVYSGGDWAAGTNAGRFSVGVDSSLGGAGPNVGARCRIFSGN